MRSTTIVEACDILLELIQMTATLLLKELEDCAILSENKWELAEYCVFDPSIVRGLAYYTGIVFEVHDIQGELRAICGGGRYDNLLHDFGGPSIPRREWGWETVCLEILLREKGLLEKKLSQAKA